MDSTGKDLLNLLFNEGEHICVSDTHFACKSLPLSQVLGNDWINLISNNPEVPDKEVKTSDLILVSINPIKENSNRLDINASTFRTFLVEIDIGTLKEQINTIDHLKMPFSAQIFSGGKSMHTVVILDEDMDEKKYRYIAKWIFNIITVADSNCANPSRCVRIPGAYRDKDKKQRLKSIKGRVRFKDFMDWLNKYKNFEPVAKNPRPILTGEFNADRLSKWAFNNLKNGIDFKLGRSNTWYAMAVDFAKAGYSEDTTIDVLQRYFEEERDFKEKEWLTVIASGFKRIE